MTKNLAAPGGTLQQNLNAWTGSTNFADTPYKPYKWSAATNENAGLPMLIKLEGCTSWKGRGPGGGGGPLGGKPAGEGHYDRPLPDRHARGAGLVHV